MDTRVISFRHLYDNHFAHFPKDKPGWIIFPQDFIPDTKKKYECYIQWTMVGYFQYNNKGYNVARAYPTEHAHDIEAIFYKYDQRKERRKVKKKTALEIAFEKAKTGKE